MTQKTRTWAQVIDDALVVIVGVLSMGFLMVVLWMGAVAIALSLLLGAVGSLLPGLPTMLIASDLPRFAAFMTWCARNFSTLALLVLVFQVWSIHRSLNEASRTLFNHDVILGGLVNYLEVQPKYPDPDRLISMSLADRFREMGRKLGLSFVPFLGAVLRDADRFQVYNSKSFREGKPATFREDLTAAIGR